MFSRHSISFARQPEHLNVDDLQSFRDFWEHIPNKSRSIPVPRRTLRALAAGFSHAVTGVCLAYLIRSVHFHKREGQYRVCGRTKGSWISEVFGISRRAVTDARSKLIDLGWITPLETTQIMLNRFGNHDRVNVAWNASDVADRTANDDAESASPTAQISGECASPYKTVDPSSNEEDLKNRNSETVPVSGSRLVFKRNERGQGRRTHIPKPRRVGKPNLRSLKAEHLSDTGALLKLYQQAVDERLIDRGDRGMIDFVAWAERARSRGRNPEALFVWLLRNQKFAFLTQADEDAAIKRIKQHREPNTQRSYSDEEALNSGLNQFDQRTKDDRVVLSCFRAAKKIGLRDPFPVAQKLRGWNRDRWNSAMEHYQLRFGSLG